MQELTHGTEISGIGNQAGTVTTVIHSLSYGDTIPMLSNNLQNCQPFISKTWWKDFSKLSVVPLDLIISSVFRLSCFFFPNEDRYGASKVHLHPKIICALSTCYQNSTHLLTFTPCVMLVASANGCSNSSNSRSCWYSLRENCIFWPAATRTLFNSPTSFFKNDWMW